MRSIRLGALLLPLLLVACSGSEPKVAWEGDGAPSVSISPEDVADAILSLITGSDLVTGETLTVDAGHTLGGGF